MTADSHPYQVLPPLTAEERAALVEDIAAHGVLVPIEVDENGAILDGHHRAEIAGEVGIECPRHVVAGLSEGEKVERAIKLNLLRRQLGPVAWANTFRLLAEGRGVRLGSGKGDPTGKAATVAALAAELGVAPRTARYRLNLADSLADRPDLATEVDAGDMPAQRALALARGDAIAAAGRPPRLPDGRFDVLLADPPWRFEGWIASRAVERVYPTLRLADICDYRDEDGRRIADLAADDAVLFMWVPSMLLFEAAPAVLDAWGFRYVTHWVWVKDKIGMGYWARNQHELVLIATRGDVSPPPEAIRPSSVIEAPRLAHSAKPVEVYDRIERLWPDSTRVELFARQSRPGWASFGDQIEVAS